MNSKRILNRSSIGNFINAHCNGITQEITNDEDKANAFADFFMDVYTREPNINISPSRDIIFQGTVRELEFTDTAILKKLQGIKTSKSPELDRQYSSKSIE